MAELPEDILIKSLFSRQTHIRLGRLRASFEDTLRRTIDKDCRILAYLTDARIAYRNLALFGCDVRITYGEHCPPSPESVEIAKPPYDMKQFVANHSDCDSLFIVTKDGENFKQALKNALNLFLCSKEGCLGYTTKSFRLQQEPSRETLLIERTYYTDTEQIKQRQHAARSEARRIWGNILGRATVPLAVRPFLAYSYLTQACSYDYQAREENKAHLNDFPKHWESSMAYGALVNKCALCGGFSWAFKYLMDEAGIRCHCINGFLRNDHTLPHVWNLVLLDGQLYHVDVTWGVSASAVPLEAMMQPDLNMRMHHQWDKTLFPAASGHRFSEDFASDYLQEHRSRLLSEGASEKYVFPKTFY